MVRFSGLIEREAQAGVGQVQRRAEGNEGGDNDFHQLDTPVFF